MKESNKILVYISMIVHVVIFLSLPPEVIVQSKITYTGCIATKNGLKLHASIAFIFQNYSFFSLYN